MLIDTMKSYCEKRWFLVVIAQLTGGQSRIYQEVHLD